VTTVLILNAASSLIAAGGVGVVLAWQRRQARKTVLLPLYVSRR
jgi:hypothetical protein